MKCSECLTVIDDLLEGDLHERACAEVTAHLAACANCANEFEDLKREQDIYSHYLLEVETTPAVWAAVSAGIQREKSRRASAFLSSFRRRLSGAFTMPRLSPLVAAALVVIMLGVAVMLVPYLKRGSSGPARELARQDTRTGEVQRVKELGQAPNSPPHLIESASNNQKADAENQQQERRWPVRVKETLRSNVKNNVARLSLKPAEGSPSSEHSVIDAEQKYQAAIAVLSRELKEHSPQLSQQKLATLKQALSVVDQAISDTSRAAHQNSNDPLTVHYMLSAYTAKMDLLREATFRSE